MLNDIIFESAALWSMSFCIAHIFWYHSLSLIYMSTCLQLQVIYTRTDFSVNLNKVQFSFPPPLRHPFGRN